MVDHETSLWIVEFLLRQPIPNHVLYPILLALPLSSSPLSPRLLKTFLLRRLASLLPDLPPQTLDTLELIEQLDRNHRLTPGPSPSLQLAYSAAAVDLTARFLKEGGEQGDFFDAVNRIWNCRVGDLERSEARGLVSRRLREERSLMEEAVVNQVARVELMGWDTKKDAAEAVAAYMKEAVEEMGPTFLEMSAATVRDGEGCIGKHEGRMPVGGNVASYEGGCSRSGFNRLLGPNVIQEKNCQKAGDERDHNMIQESVSDILTATWGVPTAGTGNDLNLERMEEHQSLMDREHTASVDNGAEVPHTKDSFGTGHNITDNIALHPSIMDQNTTESEHGEENQPGIIDQNTTESEHGEENQPNIIDQNATELEHGEENQNVLVGNAARVSSVAKGKRVVNTEGKSTLIGRKRDSHDVRAPSIMDRNPTARTMEWHDSIESPPERSPNPSQKLHILRPKRREIPTTQIPWDKEVSGRRKKKWWNADEEDTLRKAVDKYGAGNWAMIKNSYPAIFVDRTTVDLKDKWRNMTR